MKNKTVFIIALLSALILKVLISTGQDTTGMSVPFDHKKSKLLPTDATSTSLIANDSTIDINDNNQADITYKNGIRLVIPSGAFTNYPNGNIKFNPVCNAEVDKMVKMGFTTMTASGEVLSSAGVFSANASMRNGQSLPDDAMLVKSLEVWVPVTNCGCMPGNVALWDSVTDADRNIVWVKSKDSIRIERLGLKKYYVFPIRNLASINLDCPQKGKTIRLAIRKYQAVSLKLVYTRAKAIIVGKPDDNGIMNITSLNTKEVPKIYAVATDNDNNRYQINGKRMSYFKQNLITGRYIIRKQDFRKSRALRIKKVNKEEVIFGYIEY